MLIRITLATEAENRDRTFEVGSKIHESLVGNKDYIDSNIVLNIDAPGVVELFFDIDKCQDKGYIHQKIEEAINLFYKKEDK